MSEAKKNSYSLRGAWDCLRLLQRYSKYPKGCIPGREHIATKLGAGQRTVEGWLGRLKALGAIEVVTRGSRSSTYKVLWMDCSSWPLFQERIAATVGGACGGGSGGAFSRQSAKQSTANATVARKIGGAFSLESSSTTRTNSFAVDEERARVTVSPRATGVPFPEASKLSPSESEGRRQPDPNPEREMNLRLQERHPAECEACEAVIRKALRKFGLSWADFLALDDRHTKNPAILTNPRGYYFSLAAESVEESKSALMEKMRVPLGVKETARCEKCEGGFGVMADGRLCDCAMGRDLANLEKRKQARAKPNPVTVERQDVA